MSARLVSRLRLAFTGVALSTVALASARCSQAGVSPPGNDEPSDTTAVRECATPEPEWIWCDDFESDRLSEYFEYNSMGGGFVRAGGIGRGDSYGMRATYTTAGSEAGSLKLAFGKTPSGSFNPVDAGTAIYRDIYWRLYIRHPTGWSGGGPDKLTRATSMVTSQWAQAMIAHVWDGSAGDNALYIDPASGTDVLGVLQTTVYNDFANLRWLGGAGSASNIFDAEHLGKWLCVEVHVRLNDAGTPSGVFQLWIDGALEAERTGLNWLGAFSNYGINAIFFENYWNDISPVEQTRYWDNIVVSTQRVGCAASS